MTVTSRMAPVYRQVTRAALLGLGVNLLLAGVKLFGGIVGGSFALISDAINSLGDVLTSVVVLFALAVAQRPADEEHPYGHTRAEAIAASNVALVIVLSALWIGWEAVHRLTLQHSPPPVWTLWIAAANAVIKEALYQYKSRVGRLSRSSAIIANAWDHRGDALCSLAVFVGLLLLRWGGPAFMMADEIASLVVGAAILWSGVMLFNKSVHELMDVQADADALEAVRQTAQKTPGVEAVEKLWMRKSGLEYLVDIHIQVEPQLTVAEGHRIGHEVKARLLDQQPHLRDILVHLEPYSQDGHPGGKSRSSPGS